MKNLFEKIKNKSKKAISQAKAFQPANYGKAGYFHYRDCMELKEKAILFECAPDMVPAEVFLMLLKEVTDNPEYREFTIYLSGNKSLGQAFKKNGRGNWLAGNSLRYYKVLATAKYVIFYGDTAHVFAKREGQVCLNIRCEAMSPKTDAGIDAVGNGQKGLFDADYLLCENEEDMHCLIKEYRLENFAKAKTWILRPFGNLQPEEKEQAKALGRKLLFGEDSILIEEKVIPYNGKKNVVIYMGGLGKNGLTTSGANLLHTLDRTKYNYAVFCNAVGVQSNPESVRVLPADVPLLFYYDFRCLTFGELLPYILWRGFGILSYKRVKNVVKRLGVRNAERILRNFRVSTAVQFTGYNDDMIATMEQMPCKRIIYVHNDMEKEIMHRGNVNKSLLSHAYKSYDKVAAVTAGMIEPAKRIAECEKEDGKKADFTLCLNVIDYKRVLTLGNLPLEFDAATVLSDSKEKLFSVLASGKKKFVSVGRFSVEKGHERLIKAFERLHKEQPDTCLIIIGGHGNLWEKTLQQVKESSCPEDIFLVRYMSNPFPLMKQCDFFVLSSLYEGFGLVLAEADILGLPCFTVDIDGPRPFMKEYGGTLVENSEEGIYEGMLTALQGGLPSRLTVDYEEYNKQAVKQFEALL